MYGKLKCTETHYCRSKTGHRQYTYYVSSTFETFITCIMRPLKAIYK